MAFDNLKKRMAPYLDIKMEKELANLEAHRAAAAQAIYRTWLKNGKAVAEAKMAQFLAKNPLKIVEK